MEIAELLASAVDVERRAAIMWRYAPQALHEWIHALRAKQKVGSGSAAAAVASSTQPESFWFCCIYSGLAPPWPVMASCPPPRYTGYPGGRPFGEPQLKGTPHT